MKGILGRKIGMTQVFTESGKLIPVTVVEVEKNVVTQIKTKENDANNRKKVLSELEGVSDRTARFRTVITWITPTQTIQVEGIVEGEITCQEEGTGGFGYDAIFRPTGYANTFAVLSPETKNNISHRARALMALRDAIDKR